MNRDRVEDNYGGPRVFTGPMVALLNRDFLQQNDFLDIWEAHKQILE